MGREREAGLGLAAANPGAKLEQRWLEKEAGLGLVGMILELSRVEQKRAGMGENMAAVQGMRHAFKTTHNSEACL